MKKMTLALIALAGCIGLVALMQKKENETYFSEDFKIMH